MTPPAAGTPANVLGALLFLRVMSLRNLVLARLRRLKQPKYLVGAIVGVAYFYLMFFRRARFSHGGASAAALMPAELLPTLVAVGAVIVMVVVACAWLVPDQRAGIAFTEAEIAFLFPAPVRRRTLIYYKLFNSQFAILFTVALLTLFSGAWQFLGGNFLTHGIGWWIILATLNLHFMAASFVMTRLMDNGITPWRRRLLILAVLAIVVVIGVVWVGRDWRQPQPSDYANLRSVADYFAAALATGPLSWLLLPARAVVAPFLAPTTPAFLAALGPALAVFVLHFVWVLRSEVSFEEESIARSEKRAARAAAVRDGNWRAASGALRKRTPAFRLADTGRPEVAFLWKNLLSTFPVFRVRTWLIAAFVIVGGFQWLAASPGYRQFTPVVRVLAFAVGAYALFLGPQIARQDFRSDLGNADLLKTYPLRGWQVVLGEILTPVTILTGVLWLVVLALAVSFHPQRMPWLTPGLRLVLVGGLVPLVPVVCALQLLIPNAAALLFPAWVQTVRNRAERGIEAIGQRLIFLGGQLLVMLLALVPAAVGAGVLVFATQWLIGPAASVALAATGVCVILAAEVAVGLWWLGRRFEHFDLSAEK